MIANEPIFRALLKKGWDPVIIADRLALALARARSRLALPLARVAARFVEDRIWENFGYARLEDHAHERFGRSGRWLRDLRAMHEATTRCPALARAITGDDGGVPLGTVAALLVGRVATVESCDAWIALARQVTVRELRVRVREAREAAAPEGASSGPEMVSASASDPPLESPRNEDVEGDADIVTLRFSVPRAVGAAIDEARDLHRAISGGETTVSEFVEALLAESQAGPDTLLSNEGWIGARPSPGEREIAMEQKGEGWTFLREVRLDGEEMCEARRTLEDVDRLCHEAESASFRGDPAIRAFIRLENEIELRLGDLLACMGESGAWRGLRFAGVGHYAEERLGVSRSVAQGRSHLSRILRDHPALREACEEGAIGLEAASLVVRAMGSGAGTVQVAAVESDLCGYTDADEDGDETTAIPAGDRGAAIGSIGGSTGATDLEAAWIAHAGESTLKRLREELHLIERARALGSLGAAAMTPVDDETWQRARSRRPSQAIERLERLTSVLRDSPRADMVIRFRLPRDLASDLLSAVRGERRRMEDICHEVRRLCPELDGDELVAAFVAGVAGAAGDDADGAASGSRPTMQVREDGRCDEHGPDSGISRSLRTALMFSKRHCGVPEWVALLALVEGFIVTWDDPRMSPRRAADKIYNRDGWRCTAPGCSSRRNLQEHHIVYRSQRGSNASSNLVTLCSFHHLQGEHGGLMRCRGEAPLGITWWMGMGAAGGVFQNERRLDGRAQPFARLNLSA